MLKKSKKYEFWYNVKDGKSVGLLGGVPELLRLNLISAGPGFTFEDLNKWVYLTTPGSNTVYNTFEEAEADLV